MVAVTINSVFLIAALLVGASG
ncbi:MAG: hypothetical protein RLZZ616_2099, partial [Pseudomonadota bacterium]